MMRKAKYVVVMENAAQAEDFARIVAEQEAKKRAIREAAARTAMTSEDTILRDEESAGVAKTAQDTKECSCLQTRPRNPYDEEGSRMTKLSLAQALAER
jgi:hypothetical protein